MMTWAVILQMITPFAKGDMVFLHREVIALSIKIPVQKGLGEFRVFTRNEANRFCLSVNCLHVTLSACTLVYVTV